jgi:hypothetical protein
VRAFLDIASFKSMMMGAKKEEKKKKCAEKDGWTTS